MIDLPDLSKPFEYENNFYFSSDISRLGKMIAHYELFKMVKDLPGDIIECGVFKGSSLIRFATFRSLFENIDSRKVIGFDAFGKFPETNFEGDRAMRQKFIDDSGEEGIGEDQLQGLLDKKGIGENLELIKGDVCETVPEYVRKNPDLKISLVNLDTDVYEPAKTVLEELWPKIVPGGILIIDDYSVFEGETKAVDDYFKDKDVEIKKFSYSKTPHYIVKK